MPGIFSRLKTWVAGEVLTHSDLNAEFDNIINNAAGDKMDGTSHNLAEMQQTENPAPSGTPDLVQPISITDEIRRLRYAISRVIGKTNWYDAPSRSLENFYFNPLHIFDPAVFTETNIDSDVVSAGLYDSLSFIDRTFYDTTLKKYASVALKSTSSVPRFFTLDPGRMNPNYGTFSLWFRNVSALDTILYNPTLGVRVYLNNGGFIAVDLTLATAASATEKVVQTVIVGTAPLAGLSSFTHLAFSFRIQNLPSDSISLYINGQQVGSTAVGPFNVNMPMRAEHWFLNGSDQARTVTTKLTNNALPVPSGWTKVTTAGTESILNGVLTINTTTAGTLYYTNVPPSTSSSGLWVEFKVKLGGATTPLPTVAPVSDKISAKFGVVLRTNTDQKVIDIGIDPNGLNAHQVSQLTASSVNAGYPLFIHHDFHQWTTVTIQTVGGTHANIFINGVFRGAAKLGTDATAGSLVAFGDMNTDNQSGETYLEYFNMGTSGSVVYPNTTSTAIFSDFCALDTDSLDSTTLQALQVSAPRDIFGNQQNFKIGFERGCQTSQTRFLGSNNLGTTTTPTLLGGPLEDGSIAYIGGFYSDGKNPVSLDSLIKFHASVPNATNVQLAGFMTVIPKTYLGFGSLTSFGVLRDAPGTNRSEGVPYDKAVFDNASSATIVTNLTLDLDYSAVFPAGYNEVYVYVYNLGSTSASIWLDSMTLRVSGA